MTLILQFSDPHVPFREKGEERDSVAGTRREEKIAWKQPGKQSVSEERPQPSEAKAGSRQDTKWDRKGELDEARGSQHRREGPRQVGKGDSQEGKEQRHPRKTKQEKGSQCIAPSSALLVLGNGKHYGK